MEKLCAGLPKPIYVYMKYVRSLKFDQKPDYKFLKSLFEEYLKEQAMEIDDCHFDWILRKE
jgi:hypothetical protein